MEEDVITPSLVSVVTIVRTSLAFLCTGKLGFPLSTVRVIFRRQLAIVLEKTGFCLDLQYSSVKTPVF